jgi:hypothetical protein
MSNFVAYFRKQWVESKFKNWQIFHTQPVYSHTNSPIESHNNTIKQHFTARVIFHLIPTIASFQNLISFESKHLKKNFIRGVSIDL